MMAEMLTFYLPRYTEGFTYKELLSLVGITRSRVTLFSSPQRFLPSVVFLVTFSALGILNVKGLWKSIRITILLGTLFTFINAIPYNLLIVFSMVNYYKNTLHMETPFVPTLSFHSFYVHS